MDFFERQEKARKATTRLVVIYVLFVVALVATIHLLVAGAATFVLFQQESEIKHIPIDVFREYAMNPYLFAASLGGVALVILIGSLTKTVQLNQGGSKVALSLGGREVSPDTQDYKERRLINIVEEMALASGVATPRVFILDDEPGINAFAAGFSTKDAAVAVTRGALDLFNREELQAVIGHEFSHILNGDMRLNIRMISVLFGILCIAIIGQVVLRIGSVFLHTSRPRRSSKKDNGAAIGIGLLTAGALIWLIGSIGVLCARIMQAMISRQREHLADASSVQFTRNPMAMANALKLIGANADGSRLSSAHVSEVSHMLFASGLKMNLFATHPRLEDRIRGIDPTFDGSYEESQAIIQRRQAATASKTEEAGEETLHESLLAGAAMLQHETRGMQHAAQAESDVRSNLAPRSECTPPPTPNASPNTLPEDVREALRTPIGAQACISAAALSASPDIREKQVDLIEQSTDAAFKSHVERWHAILSPLPVPMRRVTCERAVNALRVLSRPELEKTLNALDRLVAVDGQIDAFEFALTRMFRHRLLPDVSNSRRRAVQPADCAEEAAYALSVLARFETKEEAPARAAWSAGVEKLAAFGPPPENVWRTPVDLPRFEKSLLELVALPPIAKRQFIGACETVAAHDGSLSDIEDNFLFAIADIIEASG